MQQDKEIMETVIKMPANKYFGAKLDRKYYITKSW